MRTHPLLFTFYSLNLHQLAPVGEAHVALLHECLVHAEGSAQVVTGVAAASFLPTLYETPQSLLEDFTDSCLPQEMRICR